MELVLVGLPGSGKSAAGRRFAAHHGVPFVDLDDEIERHAGRPIPVIFDEEGEAGFRARETAAIAALGPTRSEGPLARVIATGGGAVIAPRNRWRLYRGRRVAWLDAPPEVLAQRLRRGAGRPLLAGRDPIGVLRELRASRLRWYAPGMRVNALAGTPGVVEALERIVGTAANDATGGPGVTLLRAETPIGQISLGHGDAAAALLDALGRLEARRAIAVSEPRAWGLHGERLATAIRAGGIPVETILLPRGEAAKRLRVLERAWRELARLRAERGDPIVAIGGGALGDAAGFAAAGWLRGVPLVHVPTTLVAQIDSAIGGKSAVDLPEGKNLVGAFHQPQAVVVDTGLLATLPVRHRRAALGEAAKYAALGDEALFALLEADGAAIARGDGAATESGALAELVERCAWAKVEVVTRDEREQAGRVVLNLGHSVGHGLEAAAGFRGILHGEAVAHGLRAACAVGLALGVTPGDRAERIGRLLDRLGLATRPLALDRGAVRAAMATDKKHQGGTLRWVLPAETGVVVRSDVPGDVVERALDAALTPGAPGAEVAP